MNTPRTKRTIRYPTHKSKATALVHDIDGSYIGELVPTEFQAVLGKIVARWAHLEEMMIMFMSELMGETESPPARQIFRSVNSTRARIAIIRSLLEESPHNKDKGAEFDAIIDEFASLTSERNNYVHGLWYTNEATLKVSRADPSITHEIGPFFTAKAVALEQAENVAKRMDKLFSEITKVWVAAANLRAERAPRSGISD
jgi:hypothetical protein